MLPAGCGAFNANTSDRPLWANAEGHPGIWIRWTSVHEAWVESEQPMTYRRLGTVGRIVRCGQYGTWFVGDWRPMCATCRGEGQVELAMDRDSYAAVLAIAIELDNDVHGVDAALFQMAETLVECADCRAHPGWVVG